MKRRDTTVDILRGFGMLLVVIGHVYTGPWGHYIYSFHMPLFFFLSGYCAAKRKGFEPFGRYVLKKCRTLLLPYVIFFFISLGVIWALYHDTPSVWPAALNLPNLLKALVLSGGYLNSIPLYNFPLWFLPHMFVAELIFYWLRRGLCALKRPALRWTAALVLLAGLVLITLPVQAAFPGKPILHLNVFPASLAFLLLGCLFEPLPRCKVWKLAPWICPVLLLAGYILQLINGGGYISDIYSLLYYPAALCSIVGWFCVAQRLNSPLLTFIGRESLLFLGLHMNLFLRLIKFPQPDWLTDTAYHLLHLAVGTAVLCLLALALRGVKKLFHRRSGGS